MTEANKFSRPKPVILIVLDGWGIAQASAGNAISQASTPNFNQLVADYPCLTLGAAGEAVGLPWAEAGNSEVGHLNIGLGRILYQDLPRINKAISDKSFYQNKAILAAIQHQQKNKSQLHFLGLVSNGGVHSSIEHLHALIALAAEKKLNNFFVQAILDGRDTAFNSGQNFIKEVEDQLNQIGSGQIASLAGRFYAMDRDNHWDRIAKAYEAMVLGSGNQAESASQAIKESYQKKIFDEEFVPTVISKNNKPSGLVAENDAIIFFNFRADRARQLTKVLVLPGFDKFAKRKYLSNLFFVCFTEYEKDLPVEIAFSTEAVISTLGQVIAQAGLKQLRIAETEKYAHVTYFFNGGIEKKSAGEEHLLIPSPAVSSYDLKPEMSALELTEKLLQEIGENKYDFILVNFANPDMVSHTGNLKATTCAIEVVDKCLGRIIKAVLLKDGLAFITADHGNAETVFNMQTGMIDKEHSASPVPFIIVSKTYQGKSLFRQNVPGGDLSLLPPQGILSDIAPTILKVLGLEKPKEMTGRSLI